MLDIISEFRVNVFQATPTSYEMLLLAGWKGDTTIDFLVGKFLIFFIIIQVYFILFQKSF
jgi:hypothetical protein